jgi:hypothetical protein
MEELKNNKEKNMKQKAREKNEKNEKNEKKKIYVQTNDGRPKPSEIINVENEVFNVEEQHDTTPQNIEVGTTTNVIVAGNNHEQSLHEGFMAAGSSRRVVAGSNHEQSLHEGFMAAGSSRRVEAGSDHEQSPHEVAVMAAGSSLRAQENTIQTNRFHVLSPVSPKQMYKDQDKQLEQELQEGTEDSWSTDSQGSFVETTQFGAEALVATQTNAIVQVSMNNSSPGQAALRQVTNVSSVPLDGETNKHPEAVPIPDKVARDMAFLKESWANMTEADEAFQNVDTTRHDAESTDQGFQVHMSKQQKKSLKKLKHSSRDSYATRSKVPSKPFR